jgi:hypothetical protein
MCFLSLATVVPSSTSLAFEKSRACFDRLACALTEQRLARPLHWLIGTTNVPNLVKLVKTIFFQRLRIVFNQFNHLTLPQ